MNRVLVAGATGYLGTFITRELLSRNFKTKIAVRNRNKVAIEDYNLEIAELQLTDSKMLNGICSDVDVVISALGITRQKDNLTYMDVDYQANAYLVDEAKKSGVKKFIYISVLNGNELRYLKICNAKEKLVGYLKSSGLDYCIIRPNGFYSDMEEFLKMAKGGRVFLFGDGEFKLNPIAGEDLAIAVVDAIHQNTNEIKIGGPGILTQNEIALIAFGALAKQVKIIHLPDWVRKFALRIVRTFTSSKTYGPIEFFLTTMVMDMIAPRYGQHTLKDFFEAQVRDHHY